MNGTKMLIYAFLMLIASALVQAGAIHPFECDGTANNTFEEGGDLCVYGTGFQANQIVDVYVVKDHDSYITGQLLNPEVEKTEVTITTKGILALTKVWTAVKKGFFDLIADTNRDGKYDKNDVTNVGSGYGFVVNGAETGGNQTNGEVPEFSTVTALLALIGANYFIWKKRRSA